MSIFYTPYIIHSHYSHRKKLSNHAKFITTLQPYFYLNYHHGGVNHDNDGTIKLHIIMDTLITACILSPRSDIIMTMIYPLSFIGYINGLPRLAPSLHRAIMFSAHFLYMDMHWAVRLICVLLFLLVDHYFIYSCLYFF